MDQFLNSLPRPVLIGGSLVLAIALMFLLNPPHTACDSQLEEFKRSQTPFVFKDTSKNKFDLGTGYEQSKRLCESRKLPGNCFQFFEGMRLLTKSAKSINLECRPKIISESSVSKILWDGLSFMFRLAWGDEPPKDNLSRMGWLDTVHLQTFCELQGLIRESFSEGEWEQFREKVLGELPGAKEIGRKDTWARSLFTLKCSL